MDTVNNISFRISDGSTIKLEYHKSLPSVTALAREYAKAGYPDRYAVISDQQVKNQFTKNKLFDGESEDGVFVSIILHPSVFSSQVGLLSHLSCVALIQALEEHTTNRLGIGWVSDVYSAGRRIGGCAIEGKLDNYSSFEYIIVSFSVKLDEKHFPTRMTDMVRKVFECENHSVGMIIAKTIIDKFFTVYAKLKTPEKYMDIYKQKFLLSGKKIKYIDEGKRRSCRVVGIDKKNGSLIIESKLGSRKEITSPSGVIIPEKIKISPTD